MPEPSSGNRATIDGVECVNRAGLAELTGRSKSWVDLVASPAQRARTGCPAPFARRTPEGHTGAPQAWYSLEAARAWVDQLVADAPESLPEPEDPEELIDVAQLRFEVMRPVPRLDTMKKYVRMLRRDQAASRRSFLPEPAEWVQTIRGLSPRWRRGDAVTWQNNRPGKGGGRPPAAESRPMPTPEPDDPDELIGETTFRTRILRPRMSQGAWERAIADSVPDWESGRDGVLPRPDGSEQVEVRGGPATVYRWRAGRAAAWQNERAAEADTS